MRIAFFLRAVFVFLRASSNFCIFCLCPFCAFTVLCGAILYQVMLCRCLVLLNSAHAFHCCAPLLLSFCSVSVLLCNDKHFSVPTPSVVWSPRVLQCSVVLCRAPPSCYKMLRRAVLYNFVLRVLNLCGVSFSCSTPLCSALHLFFEVFVSTADISMICLCKGYNAPP